MGFTLIELLVVVVIIGVLATVVVVSLTSAQEKSRDAKRISDLKQIDLAIDSFYTDYQHLPGGSSMGTFSLYVINNNTYTGDTSSCSAGGLLPYLPDVCRDYGPKHTTATADAYKDVYLYGFADAKKDTYHLGAQFESSNNQGNTFTYCSSSSNCSATDTSYTGYYLIK